jgi:hypothetical protein
LSTNTAFFIIAFIHCVICGRRPQVLLRAFFFGHEWNHWCSVKASWIASSNERIQSSWRDADPQRWLATVYWSVLTGYLTAKWKAETFASNEDFWRIPNKTTQFIYAAFLRIHANIHEIFWKYSPVLSLSDQLTDFSTITEEKLKKKILLLFLCIKDKPLLTHFPVLQNFTANFNQLTKYILYHKKMSYNVEI